MIAGGNTRAQAIAGSGSGAFTGFPAFPFPGAGTGLLGFGAFPSGFAGAQSGAGSAAIANAGAGSRPIVGGVSQANAVAQSSAGAGGRPGSVALAQSSAGAGAGGFPFNLPGFGPGPVVVG